LVIHLFAWSQTSQVGDQEDRETCEVWREKANLNFACDFNTSQS